MTDEMYMSERFGAWQIGQDPHQGVVEFKLFFPDRQKNPSQYTTTHHAPQETAPKSPTYGNPQIASIKVIGTFQAKLGQPNWDLNLAPQMQKVPHDKGWVWTYHTPTPLPSGFYEYFYQVTFNNGETRYVGDPCTRYGGRRNSPFAPLVNSAFVIGGSTPAENRISPLSGGRKHLRDLIVYELMIDDFTDEYRECRAPLDAVRDKLDYLQSELGINAILFLPWTAWPSQSFSWGYTPHQYFSVEYRYANDCNAPAERLAWLKRLINDCHQRGLHVIMDGVFNHVGDEQARTTATGAKVANGFPYRWLYQNPEDSPYAGVFGGTFPGLRDLDYHNGCTQEFIRDVCFYWIDTFGIDGIRFDNTTNFYIDHETRGLPQLLTDIRNHVNDPNFALILEHLDLSASHVTHKTGATSYWNNELYQRTFDYLWNGAIDSRIVNALNTHLGLPSDKVATTYLGNHDHAHLAWQAGAKHNAGALEWYRTQPYMILLFTCPGSPMIQNGQEFAEDYWLMEDDQGSNRRVKPRPLRWDFRGDKIGAQLFKVYRQLIDIRKRYLGLRSNHIYPDHWESWQTQFNPQGYGVDVKKGIVIFHRWGNAEDGRLERFMIVVNCSAQDQMVNIPFPSNGIWKDLLNHQQAEVDQWWLFNQKIHSNWGRIYYQKG